MIGTAEQWAEDHGEHVGYCTVHQQKVLDSCELCDTEWTCIECEEIRVGDARVAEGLKCGACAYG